MEDGAQVRIITPTGIRFTASIQASDYDAVIAAGGKFGMFILPNEYRTSVGEINEENAFGENAKYCWDNNKNGKTQIIHCSTNELTQKHGGTYYFACAITNLYEDNYETDFFARAYYEINGERIWADINETNVRSVSYVAQKVLGYEMAGTYEPSEQTKTALLEYVTQFSKVKETAGGTSLSANQVGLYIADLADVSRLELDGKSASFQTSQNGREAILSSVSKGRHTAKVTLNGGTTWSIPFVYADYVLKTVEDVEAWIAAREGFDTSANAYVVLAKDIFFNRVEGGIAGVGNSNAVSNITFDGYGHVLKNFKLTSGWGLIGGLDSGSKICDLAVVDVKLSGTAYSALYCELKSNAKVENLFISGTNVTTQNTQFLVGGSIAKSSIFYRPSVTNSVIINNSNLVAGDGADKGALGRMSSSSRNQATVDGNVIVADGTVLFDTNKSMDVYDGAYTNRSSYVSGANTILSRNDTSNKMAALKALAQRSEVWTFDETTSTLYLRGNRIYNATEPKKEFTDGVHNFTATETDKYLVQDGATEYQLVLPRYENELSIAKEEFLFFFKEATGITMPVINESLAGLKHSETAKYISIGNTKMLQSAGLEADESVLGPQGARIVTKDNTIYLFGGEDNGALYAVYDFMNLMFNYEIYHYDVWEIDRVDEVKLMNFDVTDVPDVEIRSSAFGTTRDNVENLGYRFRQPLLYNDYFLPVGDVEHGRTRAGIHNTDDILPKEYWNATHPKWFADAPVKNYPQLCYTAHGDAAEYEAMVQQIVKVMVSSLKAYAPLTYPDYKFISLTVEDENTVCSCEACTAALKRYGSNAGALILLCNEVMERLQTEMLKTENKGYYREGLKLLFFAYDQFVTAPARYNNATGEWIPTVQMRDDVVVFYAQNKNVNYLMDVYDGVNAMMREQVEGWGAVSGGNICYWTYTTNFWCYMTFNDTFNHFTSEGYQFYLSNGTSMFFNQGEGDNRDSDNFDGLKLYLDSKLQWDCTQDTEQLTNAWFNAMYGVAAPNMKELFTQHQEASYYAYNLGGWHYGSEGMISAPIYEARFWPYETLNGMLETCNEAHRLAFQTYAKENTEKYKQIKRNIDLEWLSVAALMLKFYGTSGELTAARYTEITDYFFGLKSEVYAFEWAEGPTYQALWAENGTHTNVFDSLQYKLGYVYPEKPKIDWEQKIEAEKVFKETIVLQDDCIKNDIF